MIGDRAPSSPPAPVATLSLTEKQILFERLSARLILACKDDGIELVCFRFIATLDEELAHFLSGRSQIDPRLKVTSHMKRLAKDFAIVVDGALLWDRSPAYEKMGSLAEALGLFWGGRWASLSDIYHVEFR
ncbi:MAG: M15 family metallopeptidase [Acidobacteria bacterium]|nr:M15 family metallopeptidase [Acidobacteriota bacterium]